MRNSEGEDGKMKGEGKEENKRWRGGAQRVGRGGVGWISEWWRVKRRACAAALLVRMYSIILQVGQDPFQVLSNGWAVQHPSWPPLSPGTMLYQASLHVCTRTALT